MHPCLNCSSLGFKVIGQVTGRAKVARCRNCGLAWLAPKPTRRELDKFYNDFYLKGKFLSKKDSRQENERIKKIEKYKKGGKLLDIGCGPGFFLSEVAKRKNWQVWGFDISKSAQILAKKKFDLNIYTDFGNVPNDFFDVVTMHSTIEHTLNPQETLNEVGKKLKKDGLLAVSFPNLESFEYSFCRFFHLPFSGFILEHLWYFTPKVAQDFLKKGGFKILEITSRHYATKEKVYCRPLKILTHLAKLFLEYTDFGGKLKKGNILYAYAQKN